MKKNRMKRSKHDSVQTFLEIGFEWEVSTCIQWLVALHVVHFRCGFRLTWALWLRKHSCPTRLLQSTVSVKSSISSFFFSLVCFCVCPKCLNLILRFFFLPVMDAQKNIHRCTVHNNVFGHVLSRTCQCTMEEAPITYHHENEQK